MYNLSDKTQIVVIENTQEHSSILMCLQAIIANTDLDENKVIVYLFNQDEQSINQITQYLQTDKFEFRYCNSHELPIIVADVVSKIPQLTNLVLLSSEAIVSQNWLDTMKKVVASRKDIAAVISREIKHKNDISAREIIPYVMNNNDIDIALSPEENIVLNPGFDESQLLISLSKFKTFCVLFNQAIISQINWHNLSIEDNSVWIEKISDNINHIEQKHMVYTPKAKVFHASYFR